MTPIKLLFDMDGTLVDTVTSLGFAAYFYPFFDNPYNRTERRYLHEDFTEYNFKNFPKEEAAKLFRAFARPGVFSKAWAYPEAVNVVRYFLSQPESYSVQFVSHFHTDWTLAYPEKVEWLRNMFNTDVDNDFVVCKNRRGLDWDVLADDCLDNIHQCAVTEKPILVPDRPWNQGALPDCAVRCFDWLDIKQRIIAIKDDTEFFNGR
jgi:5'(3')-deoxyribonucleotidase